MPSRILIVENKTKYTDRSLKKIFTKALRIFESVERPGWTFPRHVYVNYSKGSYVSGSALVDSYVVYMNVPSSNVLSLTEEIARVFIHELYHNNGMKLHRKMNTKTEQFLIEGRFPMEEYGLKLKGAGASKMKTPIQERRAAHAKKMLEQKDKEILELEAALRRTKKRRSHWAKKVRYYEKVLGDNAA